MKTLNDIICTIGGGMVFITLGTAIYAIWSESGLAFKILLTEFLMLVVFYYADKYTKEEGE